MTNKNYKKRLKCAFLIFCYVLGCVISPLAASSESGLDDLMSIRDNEQGGMSGASSDTQGSTTIEGAESVSDFLDVNRSDWFYVYLDSLVSEGIIKGKSKTEFDPDGSFSFAECSAVIARYLGLDAYAAKLSDLLKSDGVEGSSLWYCGYFQLMHDLGIFDESSGIYKISDGYVIPNADKASSPMKRHEFASAVAKSFELDGSIPTKNVYSEVSGKGHDFIMGGHYNSTYLNKYTMYIGDYDLIPDASKEYVLKTYYNGIFNGDTDGYFNPTDNIMRCEMAKVLATIRDFSLRRCLITDYCPKPSEDKLFTDALGNTTLNYKYSLETLQRCADGFDATGDSITYTPSAVLPYGYAVDVYMYRIDGDICKPVYNYTLADGDAYGEGFTYDKEVGKAYRAVMALRNLDDNAKTEFTLDVVFTDDSIVTKTFITSI